MFTTSYTQSKLRSIQSLFFMAVVNVGEFPFFFPSWKFILEASRFLEESGEYYHCKTRINIVYYNQVKLWSI